MKRRVVSFLLAATMVATVFSGCGSSADTTEETKNESTEKTEEKTEEETVAKEAEIKTGESLSGKVTVDVDMTQYESGKKVRLWLPVAQTNEVQTIENVAYDAGAAKAEVNKDELGNQMLYVEWTADADPASRKATLSFDVTRKEILRPDFVEEGTIGKDMDEFLTASSTIPVDGEVKELADQITKDKKTIYDKARAIYDWVIANMVRDESVVGCGKGEVCALLSSKAGKCTDINSVFIGLCRASGIPAREMFGVRINDANITKNQHCWAEFYLPGTGWIAADPADVLKAVLKNGWDKESEDTKKMQEYYWGNNDQKRVELSEGRDIVLNPKQDGEALNNFGYPYAEVDGQAVDFYTPDTFIYTISFEEAK